MSALTSPLAVPGHRGGCWCTPSRTPESWTVASAHTSRRGDGATGAEEISITVSLSSSSLSTHTLPLQPLPHPPSCSQRCLVTPGHVLLLLPSRGGWRREGEIERLQPTTSMSPGALSLLAWPPLLLLSTAVLPDPDQLGSQREECVLALVYTHLSEALRLQLQL